MEPLNINDLERMKEGIQIPLLRKPHKYQVTNHPGKKIRNVREHNSNKHRVDDG